MSIKRKFELLGALAFIFACLAMWIVPMWFEKRMAENKKEFQNDRIAGSVIDTYRDHSNKGLFTVEIASSGQIKAYTNFYLDSVYAINLFQKGDSVFKESGDMGLKLFRNDSLIFSNCCC